MPRIMSDRPNAMRFSDQLSGAQIELYYRMPCTTDRVGYAAECVVRDGAAVRYNFTATRIKYGLAIVTGFRDGDFVVERDGKMAPVSSDPKSGDYDPNWKGMLERYAADLLEMLAVQVFDAAVVRVTGTPRGNGTGPEKAGDTAGDAEKNLTPTSPS